VFAFGRESRRARVRVVATLAPGNARRPGAVAEPPRVSCHP
jgi:hypothetical protein